MQFLIKRKVFVIFCASVFVALFSFYLLRNFLLLKIVERAQEKLKRQYNLSLNYDKIYFSKWNEVSATKILLRDSVHSTILSASNCKISFSVSRLLVAKLRLKTVDVDSICINILDKNNIPNYRKFRSRELGGNGEVSKTQNFIALKITNAFSTFSDAEIHLHNTVLNIKDTIQSDKILFPFLSLQHNALRALVTDSRNTDTLFAKGIFDAKNRNISCEFSHSGQQITAFELLKKVYHLYARFDTIDININWHFTQENNLSFKIQSKLCSLEIAHWRLSSEPILFPKVAAKLSGTLTPSSLQLDSSSNFLIENLPIYFCASTERLDTNFKIALQLKIPEVFSDVFFQSLPQGMFNTLKGIECSGTLAYSLNFVVDSRQIDSLVFESDLKRKNFGLKHFGAENFARINDDFIHDVIVKEQLVRRIEVGRSNPFFTSLRQVSPYLIASVLQSEDPSFMQHSGFIESAFKESLIQNIKERRFARGGSTISMQLVKNVFLNRNKNIARKAEEALIVYLIESLRLTSKERMLEVYLNLIEWGPNVYGIGEAAHFYFKKKPSELSLAESVFLAGIIPNPKYFKYHIEADGFFKPHFQRYADVIINRMLSKGKLSENDVSSFQPQVQLKGAATKFVNSPVSFDEIEG